MQGSDLTPYWNTNVARHPGILRAVPDGCRDALDVGCGDGLLARKLTARAQRVTGVDSSPQMVARARELSAGRPGIGFVEGDFLAADLPAAGYDFVCSVSAVHHMDFSAALARMRDLLLPGVRYRRHVLRRYTLTWRAPAPASAP
jgi:SAM-dependent methyltransferase